MEMVECVVYKYVFGVVYAYICILQYYDDGEKHKANFTIVQSHLVVYVFKVYL